MQDNSTVALLNTARRLASRSETTSASGEGRAAWLSRAELSVVVPAFNEEETLAKTLPKILSVAARHGDCEVIVVDDGSTDDTLRVAGELLEGYPRSELIWHPRNWGKGWAVRSGVQRARGRKVVFVDADLAPDFENGLDRAVKELEMADIAIASRAVEGAEVVGATLTRRGLGLGFRALRRIMVGLAIKDTQCGLKAFRAGVARVLFHSLVSRGFVFDVELLMTAHALDLSVAEFPIHWVASERSHIKLVRDSLAMAAGLLRLRFHRPIPPAVPAVEVSLESGHCSEAVQLASVLRHGDLVFCKDDHATILLFSSPPEACLAVARRLSSVSEVKSTEVSSMQWKQAIALAKKAFRAGTSDQQIYFV